MPNEQMSAALREAYASAPADILTLHTLEIRHPDFEAPIRVVRNYPDDQTWLAAGDPDVAPILDAMEYEDRKQVGLVARLEDDAPLDGGQMVAFIALAFELQLPDIDTIAVPEARLQIDNVGREMSDALALAANSQNKIEVTYRPYNSNDIQGPQWDPPLTLTLADVDADPLVVRGSIRMLDVGNKAFPGKTYDPEIFPGLVT
ncbi:DUF1833 family protein [Thalassospira sp. TSL5-1]|uniref:DUF1833 family protein n=1 Tax=Thalassospira sp. TSL5-1 TaxID=1544451 RepID=UPI00093E0BEB|nr:DUF1833 family protein [Thalassospira sp. TSL5-1]OKH89207.1 hypothetical protein LF95_04020 [Thalassospira sp. TSL5-1]